MDTSNNPVSIGTSSTVALTQRVQTYGRFSSAMPSACEKVDKFVWHVMPPLPGSGRHKERKPLGASCVVFVRPHDLTGSTLSVSFAGWRTRRTGARANKVPSLTEAPPSYRICRVAVRKSPPSSPIPRFVKIGGVLPTRGPDNVVARSLVRSTGCRTRVETGGYAVSATMRTEIVSLALFFDLRNFDPKRILSLGKSGSRGGQSWV